MRQFQAVRGNDSGGLMVLSGPGSMLTPGSFITHRQFYDKADEDVKHGRGGMKKMLMKEAIIHF